MKPVLLLDMDGPIADFDQAFWDLCEQNRWDLNIESLDGPGRKRFMTDNVVSAAHRRMARNVIDDTQWFRHLPVTDGARAGMPALMEHFDVWVCTKPLEVNRHCRDDKAYWLRRHFPELERKLIITPDKSLVAGHVLLDDAIKYRWIGRADWTPVVFRSVFNGPGSLWQHIAHHWSWGDPIDVLLEAAAASNYRKAS